MKIKTLSNTFQRVGRCVYVCGYMYTLCLRVYASVHEYVCARVHMCMCICVSVCVGGDLTVPRTQPDVIGLKRWVHVRQ